MAEQWYNLPREYTYQRRQRRHKVSAPSRIWLDALRIRKPFPIRILVVPAVVLTLLALGALTLMAASTASLHAAASAAGAVSSYQVSKSASTAGPLKYGDTVSFTIYITNTGDTWITTLPLRDVYSSTYLSYGNCGTQDTADPRPGDYSDDGQLDWSDLTAPSPLGFGTDLAPGASFTVIVTFKAAGDTSTLPGAATENGAEVHEAKADPDGPAGPLPEEPLPDQATSVKVQIFTPTCKPTIAGTIWHDVNSDGLNDGGLEIGIDGATINAYWDDDDYSFEPGTGDTFYASRVTGSAGSAYGHGLYEFILPHPSICGDAPSMLWVEVDSSNFAPGGALEDMVLTSGDTCCPQPALVWVPGWCYINDVDFGFVVPGSYTIAKQAVQPESQRVGQPISVSFRITNTGTSWITSLPLKSLYNTAYLTYGHAGRYASPPSDDNLNDGEITWQDLTTSSGTRLASAAGSGADLPPGGSVTVVITFTGAADTSMLPGEATIVALTSEGAFADPDGPSGPLLSLGPLPASEATAEAIIHTPTGLTLSGFDAEAEIDHVRLTWQTESEVDMLGFNVLRRGPDDGELGVLNPELIVAEHAGADQGARYTYLDVRVTPGGLCWYVLEVIHLDGRTEQYRMVAVPAESSTKSN